MLKKKYVLDFDDDRHNAVLARDGAVTQVQVDDGDLTAVNYRPVLAGKAISIRFGGRLHLVHMTGVDDHGGVQVTIGGRPVTLRVRDELKAQAQDSLGSAAASGALKADIPGLVVSVAVTVGQTVQCGEPVLVVEAMKMQNELVAPVAGEVVAIPVAEGDSVNPGDLLLEIEPAVTSDSAD